MSTVSLRGLSKSFGDVTVIDNISIEVKDKEFVSFLGPSGCGKTTTLRIIAGFDHHSQGEIYFGERLVSSVEKGCFLPPEERNIGMVFQNYAVWPHMDVFSNVAYPLRIKKFPMPEIKERVKRSLDLVQLAELEKRFPHQLSGGQQQRVALARALVMEPDVMLLDEPLSNLDAKLREEMRFEIKYLQEKLGITIIYVTHDQAEAMAMSDRIVLLNDSRIQQVGSPRDLYERPRNKFVADFIGLINFIKAEVVSVTSVFDKNNVNGLIRFNGAPDNGSLSVRLPLHTTAGSIIFAVRPENIKLLELSAATVKAEICDKVYLGNVIDYQVKLGEVKLRVEAPSSSEYQVGELVGLAFEREIVFRD